MRDFFECPVCSASDWERVRPYRYARVDETEDLQAGAQYVRLRRRILFEVWFPGAEVVELSSVMCTSCGFMTYCPRPSEADIDAKYRFLQTTEGDIGGQKADPRLRLLDQQRARHLFAETTRHAPAGPLDVLDFGGGDGKLLAPFIEKGHRCALVDYNVRPLSGVRKIGNTLDEIPGDLRFDVIIASHVIEHLAEPSLAVERLKARLAIDGVLYAEVPLGIWGGIGIESDPVTHINFFSGSSFRSLFDYRGMQVLEHRTMVGAYNRRMDVVMVVAKKGGGGSELARVGGPEETRRLLQPTVGMRLLRRVRLRRFPTIAGVLRRLGL